MNDDLKRLDELAARLREAGLTDAEQAELDSLLLRQPEARRRFVEHMLLENDLREDAGGLLGPDDRAVASGKIVAFRPAFLIPLGIAAALVLGFWFFWQSQGARREMESEFAQQRAATAEMQKSVAVVRRTSEVDADGEPRAFRVGQVLYPGALEVKTGLVQLDLYSGVSLVVEGPAALEIVSPDLVRMHSGKVRANVPPPARGFRLLAGEFDLVDLGTEFGVSLGKDGAGELHVIKGEVQVKTKAAPAQQDELLMTGKAIALNRDGSHPAIIADVEKFAGAATLRERSEKRFAAWKKMIGALANDPDTVALYDFQMGPDNRLPNLAAHGPQDTEAVVVGCTSGQGRWPEKSSLDFRNPSQRVRVKIPGDFEQLTLATWVKADSVAQFAQSFIQSESGQSRTLFWFLRHRKPAQGMVPNFADTVTDASGRGDRHPYQSDKLALPSDRTGAWMHFAVTVNNATREVVHYANGREIDRQPITNPRPLGIGLADIGNWPSRDWAAGTKWEVRNIVGNMDEFLVSRRAFSSDEIHELFRAGRP